MSDQRLYDIPGEHRAEVRVASHAAATATEVRAVFVAPCACQITDFAIIPDAAVTGNDTNTTNLNVQNRGAAGSGTTEIGNLDLGTGTDLVAYDRQAITITDTTLVEGDVIGLQFEKVGSGVLIPASLLEIIYKPT